MSGRPPEDADEPGPAWPRCGFWDWALAAYARPGVAETCLELQDRGGHDVVLLLFALWLADRGIEVDDGLAFRARRASGVWREEVVGPLRAVRRRLKPGLAALLPHHDAPEARQPAQAAALRARIKGLELAAERLQVLALADLVRGHPAASSLTTTLARANLEALLTLGPNDRQVLSTLLEALYAGRTGSHR